MKTFVNVYYIYDAGHLPSRHVISESGEHTCQCLADPRVGCVCVISSSRREGSWSAATPGPSGIVRLFLNAIARDRRVMDFCRCCSSLSDASKKCEVAGSKDSKTALNTLNHSGGYLRTNERSLFANKQKGWQWQATSTGQSPSKLLLTVI